jgi:hypothetical protein
MRIMGLCLVAVFAFTAFAASSASALPEVGRCVEKVEVKSKYTDKNCNTKAVKGNGKFEFVKGDGGGSTTFTGSSGTSFLETESGTKIECSGSSAAGKWDEDTGAIKEVESVIAKFTGCTLGVAKKIARTKKRRLVKSRRSNSSARLAT